MRKFFNIQTVICLAQFLNNGCTRPNIFFNDFEQCSTSFVCRQNKNVLFMSLYSSKNPLHPRFYLLLYCQPHIFALFSHNLQVLYLLLDNTDFSAVIVPIHSCPQTDIEFTSKGNQSGGFRQDLGMTVLHTAFLDILRFLIHVHRFFLCFTHSLLFLFNTLYCS